MRFDAISNMRCRGEHRSPVNENHSGNIALGITPQNRPAESLVSLAVRLGLQTPMVAFSGTCHTGFLIVACAGGQCYLWRLLRNYSLLFSLLKRKKEAKKEKLSPTLVLHGNVPHERQYYFCYAQHKSPGGVVGGLSAVTLPFFLRFAGGKGSAASTPWANIVRPSPP